MPITTRTIAKGVPPRVHEPKSKAKKQAARKQAHTTKQSHKRVVSESEGKELEAETEPRAKKKQRQQIEEPESEIELVEENAQPAEEEVENVDETCASEEVPDEQEVSTVHLSDRDTHRYLG